MGRLEGVRVCPMTEVDLLARVRELMALYAFSSMDEADFVERLFDLFENDDKSPNWRGLEK